MILFFEGKEYKRTLLEEIFGKDHAKVITRKNLKDDKAMLDCVGYFYNPKYQHIFILPKVFLSKGLGFGIIEIMDSSPLDNNDIANQMKAAGWPEDILTILPIYLYQAIEKYRKREFDTIATEKDSLQNVISSKKGSTETSLMDIILSLRDFYQENQNLFILTYKQNHSGFNKVNWSKTIRTQQPIINGRSVIYPFVVGHKREINYDEELLTIFFNTLRYINNEYHFHFVVDQPYNLIPDKEFKRQVEKRTIVKRLETIKNNYYNEKFVRLWELLYLFASKLSLISKTKEQEDYLLIRDFNNVFEDMIEVLLGDQDAPRSLVKQSDGKIVDHLFKGTSLTTNNRQIYYVGDSKYYKENAIPVGDALFKQYTYAKNIIQTQLNWFNDSKTHLKYRDDELTEGYNITPNFFISGVVEPSYRFTSAELRPQPYSFPKNFQFRNRIFDRDTLFLRLYDINFLFALYAYINRSQSIRSKFKEQAKKKFRDDFIKYIDEEYDFYILKCRDATKVKDLVDAHFRELNGKIFCPYDKGHEHWGLLIMGLERDAYYDNAKLIASLSEDFIIKEYHLGTEPYVYYNGLLNDVEVSRTLKLQDSLKDGDGTFRRESVLIGCYKSLKQKEWIHKNKLYNVRFNEGRTGSVCKYTQQVFTASFLLLYDYNDKSTDVECYALTGRCKIVNANKMKSLSYPKPEWSEDEEYLLYGVGDKIAVTSSIKDILNRHPEVSDGRPLFLYFHEVDCEYD